MGLQVIKYNYGYKDKWDRFVLNESFNGTFLQSRAFLEYHGTRFSDDSILFVEDGAIVAVCPAAELNEGGLKVFSSHCGSTFGGIIIAKRCNKISDIEEILSAFDDYLVSQDYGKIVLKQTSEIFCSDRNDLLFYLLFKNNYSHYDELSFALPFPSGDFDIVSHFDSKRRNLYKSSLKNGLTLRELMSDDEIKEFHRILTVSLLKHNAKPVHSIGELLDLKKNRIPGFVRFYGVFYNEKMVAGSMVFLINGIFHTQYLCADPDYLFLKPMDFMDATLLQLSKEEGYLGFSFGISTEEHGQILNENLSRYKYSFGTNYYINKTFYKTIKKILEEQKQ